MKLPPPRYCRDGLREWLAAVPLRVPAPPGSPETWTSLFNAFGPRNVLAVGDRTHDRAVDAELLRALLAVMGRPTDPSEQEVYLLATPIPGDVPLGPSLARLLRDPRYPVRQHAALCLGFLGERPAVPALIDALADDDNDARRGAAEALGRLGDATAATALARGAWDSDLSVSVARIEAIDRLGAWEAVAGVLDRKSGEDAAALANAMIEAMDAQDCGDLAAFLEHSDRDVQRAAAAFLGRRPDLAGGCLDALLSRLREAPDENVVPACAVACGHSGEEALEPLVEMLRADSGDQRAYAAIALSSHPALAALAADELTTRLDDDDEDARREAALALVASGRTSPRAETFVAQSTSRRFGFLERAAAIRHPATSVHRLLAGDGGNPLELLTVLADPRGDSTVRGVAAMLLALHEPGRVGPLLDAMARDDARVVPFDVRRACAAALLLTGSAPRFLPTVHRVLLAQTGEVHVRVVSHARELVDRAGELAVLASKDGDWPVRIEALRLLQALGPDALAPYTDTVAYVSRHDPDADVRRQAAAMTEAAWRRPGAAEHVTAALVPQAGVADDGERVRAYQALAAADPDMARQLARLFLRGDEQPLARAAAEVLGRSAAPGDANGLVTHAVARLDDASWIVREAACVLLGAIAVDLYPDGVLDEVVEALRVRADDDSDGDVRNAANAALARLGQRALVPEEV